jgi:hypothetical protein
MIEEIYSSWFWACNTSRTHKVGIPSRRTITAQVCLARVAGGGSIRAFIREYCYYSSPDQILCAWEPNPDNCDSVIRIGNARSVIFEVDATNGCGYAIWTVFLHS